MERMDVSQFKRASKAKKPKKAKGEYKLSSLEAKFLACIAGLPQPEREHRFHPVRKWRLDFVWLDRKLAVEVHGGAFTNGAHNRGGHQASDLEKLNEAQLLGWKVLGFNTIQMKDAATVRQVVERALAAIASHG